MLGALVFVAVGLIAATQPRAFAADTAPPGKFRQDAQRIAESADTNTQEEFKVDGTN